MLKTHSLILSKYAIGFATYDRWLRSKS